MADRFADLVVDAFATFRLTRLIVHDKLTETPRAAVVEWAYRNEELTNRDALSWREWAALPYQDDDAPKLATFVTCPWCVGVWVAFGIVAARRFVPKEWAPVAEALALSGAAGALSRWTSE